MKSDKELFELFRKNQYRLNERPSPHAWKRLERKLDNHRNAHRAMLRRTLGMAASLAFLVFTLFLLTVPNREKDLSQHATPQFWEELPTPPDTDHGIAQLVNLSHLHQRHINQSVEEKSTKQKIVPNSDYFSD